MTLISLSLSIFFTPLEQGSRACLILDACQSNKLYKVLNIVTCMYALHKVLCKFLHKMRLKWLIFKTLSYGNFIYNSLRSGINMCTI